MRVLSGVVLAIGLGTSGTGDQMPQAQDHTRIGAAFGVLVVERFERTDTVRFYNADGSQWYKFTFYYDDRDGKFDYPNPDFEPLEFDVDEFGLGLEVVGERPNGYTVIVNRKKGLRKRVRQQHFFKFLTWEQYVLGNHLIDFTPSTNPLHIEPRADSDTLRYQEDQRYEPVKIQGPWLQIKWQGANSTEYGWIQWRDATGLIIYFLKD